MPIRMFFAAAALTFAVALPVRAAAAPEPLPDRIEAHIALKSMDEFIGNIDAYVAAATKGTANAIPPGFIGMLAQISLPIPFDTWDSDGELHILVPRAEAADDPDDIDFVAVFGVPDFPAFIQSLAERDWLAGEAADKGEYREVRPVVLPDGLAMVMVDLGDGRAALGRDVPTVARALNGWTPALASDADVIAHFAMGGDGARLRDSILDRLNREKAGLAHAVADAGFKPDIAGNLIATVEKSVHRIVDEFTAMQSAVVELRFAGDDCIVDLGVDASSGSLAHEIAGALTAGKAVDAGIGGNLPPGAVSVAVGASPADIIPDAKNRLGRFAAFLYGGVVPEYRDDIATLVSKFMDSGPGQTATGSYINNTELFSFTVTAAKDPGTMLTTVRGMLDLFNTVWASVIDDPGLGFTLAGEALGEGDAAYYRCRPVFADEARFQLLLDRIADGRDDLELGVEEIKRFRLFFARLENGVASASGELTDDEFLARLAGARSPAGGGLIASDKAKALLAAMPAAQATAVVLDAGGFSRMYALQMARDAGVTAPDRLARLVGVLDNVDAAGRTDADLTGFSVGGEKGRLHSRLVLPAGAISRIIRNIEALRADAQRSRVGAPVPDPAGVPDEYEDDLEEEEEPEGDDASAA